VSHPGHAANAAPDVLGLPLERATELLAAAGRRVRVLETAPPRSVVGARRVVRQREAPDGAVELTAAAQVELEDAAPPSQRDRER
jgi:hypothetical protein